MSTPANNGRVQVPQHARNKPARPKKSSRPAEVRVDRATHVTAKVGVIVNACLSALLNAYAHAMHSPSVSLGVLLGVAVPGLTLILFKIASGHLVRGDLRIGYFAGGSAVGLLGLSVWHCANSIGVLTGSPLVLAIPMSVAIDCGMIACELSLTRKPDPKE